MREATRRKKIVPIGLHSGAAFKRAGRSLGEQIAARFAADCLIAAGSGGGHLSLAQYVDEVETRTGALRRYGHHKHFAALFRLAALRAFLAANRKEAARLRLLVESLEGDDKMQIDVRDGKLVTIIDITEDALAASRPSSTGKTRIVDTTSGFRRAGPVSVSVNCIAPNPR